MESNNPHTGLRCPGCGRAQSHRVIVTRYGQFGLRRRRQCGCGARFTTLEMPVSWDTPEALKTRQAKAQNFRGALGADAFS